MTTTTIENKINKRIAIFAHYDKECIIQDYVVYYIQQLKNVADKIIFVSDSNIKEEELKKIQEYLEYSIVGRHEEYDFGSYKRGYIYAREQGYLEDCDELIFANDSCYAPLFSFEEMFSKMSPQKVDFWGATKNHYGFQLKNNIIEEKLVDHIQSYFIVFKEKIFNSDIFKSFINSICKKNSKEEVISEYEIGLSELLSKNGFKWDVYSEISKDNTISNPSISKYKQIIKKERFPFLKRNVILYKESQVVYPIGIKNLINNYTNYNYNLIKIDKKHNSLNLPLTTKISKVLRIYRRKLIKLHFKEMTIYVCGYKISYKK